MGELLTLSVPGAELRVDPLVGNIPGFVLDTPDGRRITPLHRAPWADDPVVQADDSLPLVVRRLAGDFLCAPYGESTDAPLHGWTANSRWDVEEVTRTGRSAVARMTLMRPVSGARVTKEVRLVAGVPIVAQTHRISGGDGPLGIAHHAMVRMAGGGWLSFSAKSRAWTPEVPPEPGCNRLVCPAEGSDISAFPGTAGPVDLHRVTTGGGHEDLVVLSEAAGATLGWTVAIRDAEDDLVFVLKEPRVLPVTLLSLSGGGRTRAPWNGSQTGVVAIGDGCTDACAGPDSVAAGLALASGRVHEIRQVIGAVPRPAGWIRVVRIEISGARLVVTEASGETLQIPFARGILANGGADTR